VTRLLRVQLYCIPIPENDKPALFDNTQHKTAKVATEPTERSRFLLAYGSFDQHNIVPVTSAIQTVSFPFVEIDD
jgi:hypothetical protein